MVATKVAADERHAGIALPGFKAMEGVVFSCARPLEFNVFSVPCGPSTSSGKSLPAGTMT